MLLPIYLFTSLGCFLLLFERFCTPVVQHFFGASDVFDIGNIMSDILRHKMVCGVADGSGQVGRVHIDNACVQVNIQCIWISHHQFWSKSSVVYILIPQNEIIFINHNFCEILERVGLILWFIFKVFNDASFEVLGQLTQCYGCPLQTVWQPKSFTDELGNSSFQAIYHMHTFERK